MDMFPGLVTNLFSFQLLYEVFDFLDKRMSTSFNSRGSRKFTYFAVNNAREDSNNARSCGEMERNGIVRFLEAKNAPRSSFGECAWEAD